MSSPASTSTRPYLIRALHEWCTDNGWTPYLAVQVDRTVRVPQEYVNDGQIVLNVGYDATGGLQLGNEYIEFKARFNGHVQDILVPVQRVLAIYAKENGEGMAFPPVMEGDDEASPQAFDVEVWDAGLDEPARDRDAESRPVIQLVTASETTSGAEDDETPPPAPPTGSRPALKRVK